MEQQKDSWLWPVMESMPKTPALKKAAEQTVVDVADGKYTVIVKDAGGIEVLRHGEPWRDETGNNLIYWLAVELAALKEKENP